MIDLRSDVVAPATEAMWEAMRRAELGWAMVGDDPSVNELEGHQIQSRSRGNLPNGDVQPGRRVGGIFWTSKGFVYCQGGTNGTADV